MPASKVMELFRSGELHSGKGGPVVRKKSQATAIQIEMARKEGHHIPLPKKKKKRSRMAEAFGKSRG